MKGATEVEKVPSPNPRQPLRIKGDIAPFGLRITSDLRAALQREASANGRSLNAEILTRLWESIEPSGDRPKRRKAEGTNSSLTDLDREMLTVFKRMRPDKQLGLLTLFR